jgi:hypothetical protein
MALTIPPVAVLTGSLPVGVNLFGPITPAAGVNNVQVVVDRALGIATLAGGLITWSIELSLDGGSTWTPWGGATTRSGPALSSRGLLGLGIPVPITESSFTVNLPALADANTRIRGHVITEELTPTAISIRQAQIALPVLGFIAPHQSVSTADLVVAQTSGSGVGSLTTPAMTITSNSNRAGVLCFSIDGNGSTPNAASIGGVNGTSIANTDTGTSIGYRNFMYQVIAPPSGSQTATMGIPATANLILSALVTSGVDQTTPFNNGTFAVSTINGSPTLPITSVNGDLTVDVQSNNGATGTDAPNQTPESFQRVGGIAGGTSIGPGTGNTTHNWTTTGNAWLSSGCSFVAAAAAADAIGPANIVSSAGRFIGWTV